MTKREQRGSKGFTLAEMAIVVALIGIVASGIWAAAAHVWRVRSGVASSEQLLMLVQNARVHYLNSVGIDGACDTSDITADFANLGLVPSEMLVAGGTIRSDAGPVSVFKSNVSCAGGRSGRFRVVLSGVDPKVCAYLLFEGVPYQDKVAGITALCGSGGGAAACAATAGPWEQVTCNLGQCGVGAVPLTLAQVNARCGTGRSTLGWEFKLRN